ncbi:hypothetical protein KSP35_03840 [Aquihabitans sp. G128]|uniref:hypothetical protein n=1 Tax=Aquihabitans sp. G128 TaxID=2849779 RepID=UPI001C22BD10|nr:hypothetical protein [Aquihabitans sp. G128]QXC61961.1 hypothetical protein KSP35_03840 [Aquihabitans sp. G128]
MTDDKRPVDQAVELVLFAPIGFALEARRLLPSFVERGKQQVAMAKMIGQFAVKQGQTEGKARLSKAQEQAEAILTEFGLRPADGGDEPDPVAPVAAAPAPSPAPKPAATPRAAKPAVRSSAAATGLAIPDYDSLAASQVIPRLAGLEAAELEAVRSYEAGHRGRKTILGKVAQLQGE